MRDVREVAMWLMVSDFLMMLAAIVATIAPLTSDPLHLALTLNSIFFATLSAVSLVIAVAGFAVAVVRWRKSK